MRSPYFIDEPASISFSGGRTSAYMLWRVLEAHGGQLRDDTHILFANTGKEMPQTLDFIKACGDNWGVDITWLEYAGRSLKDGVTVAEAIHGKPSYDYTYSVVDYETASRQGEPFLQVMRDLGGIPNPMARWCSGQLKARTMRRHLETLGHDMPFLTFIGLRGDEPRRAAKLHNKVSDGQDIQCPMFIDGKTKEDVSSFWKAQPFDLELPNNNGVTDWGNCDLCFLKGKSKRLSIIRERPELADWWVGVEKEHGDLFDRGGSSYESMQVIASDQPTLFDFGDDETIPCYCGD